MARAMASHTTRSGSRPRASSPSRISRPNGVTGTGPPMIATVSPTSPVPMLMFAVLSRQTASWEIPTILISEPFNKTGQFLVSQKTSVPLVARLLSARCSPSVLLRSKQSTMLVPRKQRFRFLHSGHPTLLPRFLLYVLTMY
jgi:hypothetical protein